MGENILGGGWLAVIVIIVVLMFGGRLFGGDAGRTEAAINDAVNNQSTQNGIRDVLLSSANNNYETAQLINQHTMMMMQQHGADQISMLQSMNAMNLANANQFSELRSQISAIGHQMEICCCDIKTKMLEYRLDDSERRNLAQDNQISNYNQTQTLLGTLGRWVANPPVAEAAAAAY
jgi:hypothetical protein